MHTGLRWSEHKSGTKKNLWSTSFWPFYSSQQHVIITLPWLYMFLSGPCLGDTQKLEDKWSRDEKSTRASSQISQSPQQTLLLKGKIPLTFHCTILHSLFITWKFLHLRKLSQNGDWANFQNGAFTLHSKCYSTFLFSLFYLSAFLKVPCNFKA